MLKIIRMMGLTCLLGVSTLALAIDGKNKASEQIDQMMDLSGWNEQIRHMESSALAGMDQNPNPELNLEQQARLRGLFSDAFGAARVQGAVADALRNEYDEKKFTAGVTLLNSTIARKMTKLESAAATPEQQQALQAYAATLEQQPPPLERVELMKKLILSSGALDVVVDMQMVFVEAMGRAMNPLAPAEKRLSEEQIVQKLDEMRSQVEEAAKPFLLVSSLYIYRGVSDEDLNEYLALYESDTGRWLTDMFHRVTNTSSKSIAANLAQRVVVDVAQNNK